MNILSNFLAVTIALVVSGASFPALAQKSSPSIKLNTVVIDPGHGGKDAGCISPDGKTKEKTVVLDIATRLANKIREGYPEMKVIQTRTNDTFVELQGRADIANRNKANLFISIHVNSVEGKRSGPNGYSVHILGQYTSKNKDLYAGNMDVVRRENSVIKLEDGYNTKYEGFDPSDPESYIFMNLMQNSFLEQSLEFAQCVDKEMMSGAIRNSRGISQDPFWVLWRTAMPAVLIECGFMSNPEDRAALNSEEGRERIASDIYDAFRRYKKGYDGGSTSSNETAKKPYVAPKQAEAAAQDSAKNEENVSPEQNPDSLTETKAAPETDAATVLYGTQVLATSKNMSANDPYFKKHEFVKCGNGHITKYVIGTSESLAEAKKNFQELKKDFPDSFLVKIENGQVSAAH